MHNMHILYFRTYNVNHYRELFNFLGKLGLFKHLKMFQYALSKILFYWLKLAQSDIYWFILYYFKVH